MSDRLQQYENARSAYFTGFTGDGGILVTTRFAETSQVHKVDEPMGMRRQLTFYDEPVGGAVVREGDRSSAWASRCRRPPLPAMSGSTTWAPAISRSGRKASSAA